MSGGPSRNRTGVYGFAVRCVTTPPRGQPKAPLVVFGGRCDVARSRIRPCLRAEITKSLDRGRVARLDRARRVGRLRLARPAAFRQATTLALLARRMGDAGACRTSPLGGSTHTSRGDLARLIEIHQTRYGFQHPIWLFSGSKWRGARCTGTQLLPIG